MKNFINNVATTTIQGLLTILVGIMAITAVVLCALIVISVIVMVFGPHDMLWLRLLGVLILAYGIGRLVNW
jgi:hypothetical protein